MKEIVSTATLGRKLKQIMDTGLMDTDKKISERDRFQSHCHLPNFEFGNISEITHCNFIFFVSLGLFSFFEQKETL